MELEATKIHAVRVAPDELPPVTARAIERCWDVIRETPPGGPAPTRVFRFTSPDRAEQAALLLGDPLARRWAQAIERRLGLRTVDQIAACLRALALAACARDEAAPTRLPALPKPAFRLAATLPVNAACAFDADPIRPSAAHPASAARPPRSLP